MPAGTAHEVASLPPVSTLFATFLGNNPIQHLLGPALGDLPAAQRDTLTGYTFFPHLVAGPFHHGLVIVFGVAAVMAVIAAVASAMRGRHAAPEDADVRDVAASRATGSGR